MKKIALLLLFMFLLSPLFPGSRALPQDGKAAQTAPIVSSYLPAVGHELHYSVAQVVSGNPVQVTELVMIKALTPKFTVIVRASLKNQILTEQEVDWAGLSDDLFKEILERVKPDLQQIVISGHSFNYVALSAGPKVYWFVTDGKRNIFPGVLKIARVHQKHLHTELELIKISMK